MKKPQLDDLIEGIFKIVYFPIFLFFHYPVYIWRNRKPCPYWKGTNQICGRKSLTPKKCLLGDATFFCLHYPTKQKNFPEEP